MADWQVAKSDANNWQIDNKTKSSLQLVPSLHLSLDLADTLILCCYASCIASGMHEPTTYFYLSYALLQRDIQSMASSSCSWWSCIKLAVNRVTGHFVQQMFNCLWLLSAVAASWLLSLSFLCMCRPAVATSELVYEDLLAWECLEW